MLQKRLFSLALCVGLLLAATARSEDLIDLTGFWIGEGYGCTPAGVDQKDHLERVEVFLQNGALVAEKLDGNLCITSEEVTWRARKAGRDFAVGARIAVDSHFGAPNGDRSWRAGEIRVIDRNTLHWVAPRAPKVIIFRRLADRSS